MKIAQKSSLKHQLGLWFLLLLISPLTTAGQFADVKVEKINERVYALLGSTDVPSNENGGYVNNVLAIVGDQGVILVDAGSHYSIAEHINDSIKRITTKPVTHILVTHHHPDHHLGASYFSDAEVIASEYCAQQIEQKRRGLAKAMERMTGMDLSDTEAVVPQTRIPPLSSKPMTIQNVNLEVITTATAHTQGDMMVYLPDDNVLASGDILVHGVNPNFNDGNLKSWLGVLDQVRQLPITTIMPGHGSLMQREDVKIFQAMMTDFYNTIVQIYDAAGDMSDVRNKLDPRWQGYSRYDAMMGRNISKAWLDVEAERF